MVQGPLKRSDKWVFRSINSEVFLASSAQLARLRGVAADVWRLLEQVDSEEELTNRLLILHPELSPDELLLKVRRILVSLQNISALEPTERPTGAGLVAKQTARDSTNAGILKFWAIEKPTLFKLSIELTFACNLRCNYCYAEAPGHDLYQRLPGDKVDQLLESAAKMGALMVTFTGGEPTLHPEFPDMLRRAAKLGYMVHVNTNGTHISERLLAYASAMGHVVFSVTTHGSCENTHDSFTQVPGSYAKMLKGIQLLKEAGIPILLKVVFTKRNFHELPAIASFAQRHALRLSRSPLIYPTANGNGDVFELACSEEEILWCMREGGYVPGPDPCGAAWTKLVISPDGTVLPCNFVRVGFGNIFETSLESVWEESEMLNRVRREHWFTPPQQCKECARSSECPRCAAIALHQDGDIHGPSTQACRISQAWATSKSDRGDGL